MIKITVEYFGRLANFEPDYNRRIERWFTGESAADVMKDVMDFKRNHDINRYTPAEIVNVEELPDKNTPVKRPVWKNHEIIGSVEISRKDKDFLNENGGGNFYIGFTDQEIKESF